MDTSRLDNPGVLAWCNSIRLTIAQDPGRQFLDEQIQKLGFDFLEDYVDNVFKGPQTESVTDLLKTPGRKRDAPVRTRAAAAAAAKARSAVTISLEMNEPEKENQEPVNAFHRALLQAKEENDIEQPRMNHEVNADSLPLFELPESGPPVASSSKPMTKPSKSKAKAKAPKIVVIVDSPVTPRVRTGGDMDIVDEEPTALPAEPARLLSVASTKQEETMQDDFITNTELSIIAEDDEPSERSRMSIPASHPMSVDDHVAPEVPPAPLPSNDVILERPTSPMMVDKSFPDVVVDEQAQSDVTSSSVQTFQSIPLDSPVAPLSENVTATTPLVHLPSEESLKENQTDSLPIGEATTDEAAMSHLTSTNSTNDISVPVRDGPSVSGPSLLHKSSVSQFANLPAPSPLHKSTRFTREPSADVTAPLPLPTAAPMVGGKRSSWLVKAREAKALEGATKRISTIDGGLTHTLHPGGKKRKSSDLSRDELQGASLPQAATSKPSADIERFMKQQKLSDPEEEQGKGKGANVQDVRQDVVVEQATIQTYQEQEPERVVGSRSTEDITIPLPLTDSEGGMLANLKRTVQGLGARAGKSMGKSLGGNAAAALAEARAAAEARVAERNRAEGRDPLRTSEQMLNADSVPADQVISQDLAPEADKAPSPQADAHRGHSRLSVSDLVATIESKAKSHSPPASQTSLQIHTPSPQRQLADTSGTTTPPHSPPPPQSTSHVGPPDPVFKNPPVVFVAPPASTAAADRPPPASTSREFSFKLPQTNPFSIPAAVSLGVPASFPSSSHHQQGKGKMLSAQSSKASIFSDTVFDTEDSIPAWMPTTQDTDYSQVSQKAQNNEFDEDDSWHVDEKFASNQMWTPFGCASADKDDSMTWSTLPSQSMNQKDGDTQPLQNFGGFVPGISRPNFSDEVLKTTNADVDVDEDMNSDLDETDLADAAILVDDPQTDSDMDDIILAGQSTVSLVTKTTAPPARSASQMSTSSTNSSQSQSQLGFFSQASKLVTSVLGGSKKTKPEPVKSLALAAAAAKKQQEETEKKASRLKEMEIRRQQVMQKKADSEKARAMEEERKFKEETERRKREREEHTDKRPLRAITKKAEEDTTKKRKITVEPERKPEAKKPASKDQTNPPPRNKVTSTTTPGMKAGPAMKSALKQPSATNIHSIAVSASSNAKPGSSSEPKLTKTVKPTPTSNLKSAAKGKGKMPAKDDELEQTPSKVLQAQMANRVKAQLQAAQPTVTSESIELPDINSEYSDSEDEDRPRSFNPPNWAQSPELREALQQQSTMNPDDIFGQIGPLRMEDIFKTRQSRFRARTSSANWTGVDQLTEEEEKAYARRMGFR